MKEELKLLDTELSSYVNVKKRELQPSQKEAMFENTILKDYRRRMWLRRCAVIFSVAAAVALALILTKPSVEAQVESVDDAFLAMQMPQKVTIVSAGGSISSEGEVVRVTYSDGIAAISGGDSLAIGSAEFSYILVPQGCKCVVRLSDGSSVALNSLSRLAVPGSYSSSSRDVRLSGEAVFNVAHLEGLPFTVDASIVKTTVLGTEFLVNSYPGEEDRAGVALYRGKVVVELSSVEAGMELSPNEMLSVKGENYIKTEGIPEDLASWRPCEILELDEPLNVLLDRVAAFYGLTIDCSEDVSGTFCHGRMVMNDTPEDFFSTLSKLVPVQCRFENDNNLIITKLQ